MLQYGGRFSTLARHLRNMTAKSVQRDREIASANRQAEMKITEKNNDRGIHSMRC